VGEDLEPGPLAQIVEESEPLVGEVGESPGFWSSLFGGIAEVATNLFGGVIEILSNIIPGINTPTPIDGYVWVMPITYEELESTGFNTFTNVEFSVVDTYGATDTDTYTGTIRLMTSEESDLLYLFNPSSPQIAYGDREINLTGLTSYIATASASVNPSSPYGVGSTSKLRVSATIGGVTKHASLSSPALYQHFQLSYSASQVPLSIYGGISSPVKVTLYEDIYGSDGSTLLASLPIKSTYYTGTISFLPFISNNQISELFDAANSRYAGTLFFLKGTTPGSKNTSTNAFTPSSNPHAQSYYCPNSSCPILSPSDSSVQIWYQDINNITYPFIIQFFDYPFDYPELNIQDKAM